MYFRLLNRSSVFQEGKPDKILSGEGVGVGVTQQWYSIAKLGNYSSLVRSTRALQTPRYYGHPQH